MPLKLILMRHAKSDWNDPLLSDHDRPLNPRGQADATLIGRWLKTQGHQPDVILCSTATRTVESYQRCGIKADVTLLRDLYHASENRLLNTLQSTQAQTVMIIAHNPGIAYFAERILAKSLDHGRFHDYPTAATLVAEFDADQWSDVEWNTGRPIGFITPKDLK